MFGISRSGSDEIADGDWVDQIEHALRSRPPGRYHVNQLERDPLPSGHSSYRWGLAIRMQDGSVVSEPDPWEA
jgi:hypothetical protein